MFQMRMDGTVEHHGGIPFLSTWTLVLYTQSILIHHADYTGTNLRSLEAEQNRTEL